MSAIPEKIQLIIQDYVQRISREVPIKKAYLFGSYAKGHFTESSDIFTEGDYMEPIGMLMRS